MDRWYGNKKIIKIELLKEPYRKSTEDQAHYFLCNITVNFSPGVELLFTEEFLARDVAAMINISIAAFYKRLNKWGWKSPRLYDEKKAITLTSKDDIGNDAWKALSDKPRDGNLKKLDAADSRSKEKIIFPHHKEAKTKIATAPGWNFSVEFEEYPRVK